MNNTNMYNQPNGMNTVPQNMGQAPIQQGYNGQVVNNMAVAPSGVSVNGIKNTLANVDKDAAKRIIGMVCGVLILLSIFVPYISVSAYGYKVKASVWDSEMTILKIGFLLMGIIPIATYFLQKAKSLACVSAGYTLSFAINYFDNTEGFSSLSFGFYFMIIASVALIVLGVMENLEEIKAMVKTKPTVVAGGTVANINMPQQPSPMMNSAVAPQQPVQQPAVQQPVQPVIRSVEICNHCGQPKRNPADTVCPGCGQSY